MNNGRVPDIKSHVSQGYNMTDFKRDSTFYKEATRGEVMANDLSRLFFSDMNIDALQEGIRFLVWRNTCQKHVIGRQSEEELKIIMRSIYLQHSKNLPFAILEQVRELNGKVLEYAVEKIVNELNIYLKYCDDLSSLPVPMQHATNTSSRGTKVLEIRKL